MSALILSRYSRPRQYVSSLLAIFAVAALCFVFNGYLGYKIVAFVLMVVISLLAMVFDVFPVLITALVGSLLWNFFFIPPSFTFHIDNAEDMFMFFMFFIIASIHAVLTYKIRLAEKRAAGKEERENTIRLYNTLLNSLSHELKTPISTILGAVDTLKENHEHLSDVHRQELLVALDIASVRLNRQVENLLNMGRLESGFLKLKRDWTDAGELVYGLVKKNFNEYPGERILIRSDDKLPLFRIDYGLLEVALYNIIHNALQYTPESEPVTIEVLYRDGLCVFVIKDKGPGFPEDQLSKVFNKFYRLPNTKAGGTGLGLSIAKGYIEAHGGVVFLENNPAGGAIFTLEIPAETSFINQLKNE